MIFLNWLVSEKSAGILTVLGGFIALLIYASQVQSQKSNAAQILILEIRQAEQGVEALLDMNLSENSTTDGLRAISILPNDSWERYKHLFVKDFDIDEFQTVNKFFHRAILAQKELEFIQNFLNAAMEEKIKITQEIVWQMEKNQATEKNLEDFYAQKYWFKPFAPINNLKNDISRIEKISTTNIGEKLKKIANIKK